MFTVRPDEVRPSPRVDCSFSVTLPTPGSAICWFGAGESPTATPPTTNPAKPEPAPLLLAVVPLLALLASPLTAFAVIRPFRMLTFDNTALLCALEAFSPTAPVAIDWSVLAVSTPGRLTLAADASAIPGPGSVASGD